MKNSKGFTLIELLVVISIIGLLSSIVLSSIQKARQKADITKFKEEMISFKNALELYKNDNGYYPIWGASLEDTIQWSGVGQYMKSQIHIPDIFYRSVPSGETPGIWYQYTPDVNGNHNSTNMAHCGENTKPQEYVVLFATTDTFLADQFEKLYAIEDGTTYPDEYCAAGAAR